MKNGDQVCSQDNSILQHFAGCSKVTGQIIEIQKCCGIEYYLVDWAEGNVLWAQCNHVTELNR